MIMNLIKLTSIFLLFMPLAVMSKEVPRYSDAYTKCMSRNIDNPMSTNCVDSEISMYWKEIKEIALKHKDIVSPEDGVVVDLNSYATQQQKTIDNKCSLWLKAGGQNGILLEKQCVLEEIISLNKLLNDFVSTVDD